MPVEKGSDDLWLGVKGQSNWEIAGSPRKIFRYRLGRIPQGVEHWMGYGDLPSYQTQPNSEYLRVLSGSHTAGANVRRGEGNNPDLQLRPPIRG